MDKQRLILVADFQAADGKFLPKGTYVWLWERLPEGTMKVEKEECLYIVPWEILAATPVPPASLDELRKKDSCFGAAKSAFQLAYQDNDYMFAVYRCHAHGAFFLEDVRGEVGWYSRFIYLGASPGESAEDYRKAWRIYNRRGDDELNLEGLAGPMPT